VAIQTHELGKKCHVVTQTSEFEKRRYVAMKVLNQGKTLCGNKNIQTVKKDCVNMEKVTVWQYKVLRTAEGLVWQYSCLKKGKLL
jgi:hypothetical protein